MSLLKKLLITSIFLFITSCADTVRNPTRSDSKLWPGYEAMYCPEPFNEIDNTTILIKNNTYQNMFVIVQRDLEEEPLTKFYIDSNDDFSLTVPILNFDNLTSISLLFKDPNNSVHDELTIQECTRSVLSINSNNVVEIK